MMFRFLLLVSSLMLSSIVGANESSQSPFPYKIDYNPALQLNADDEIIVRGVNPNNENLILVVRIDDGNSTGYSTRVNEERFLIPGPFELHFSVAGLRTPSGRKLQLHDIRKIYLFGGDNKPRIDIESVKFEKGFSLPEGTLGWDFGPKNQAIFPSFKSVTHTDPSIDGQYAKSRKRRAGDALLQDGIIGLDKFETWVPNGQWMLTLWIEEIGEWEYLPHSLERQVIVNGRMAYNKILTAKEWMQQRYLSGMQAEAVLDGDIWHNIGRNQGQPITTIVNVKKEKLTIEFHGNDADARYISAMVAVPADEIDKFHLLQAERKKRFNNLWRSRDINIDQTLTAGLYTGNNPSTLKKLDSDSTYNVAKDSMLSIDYWVVSDTDEPLEVSVDMPKRGKNKIDAEHRVGRWHFTRPGNSATLVQISADHLTQSPQFYTAESKLPRRVNILFAVPEEVNDGAYTGTVRVTWGEHSEVHKITLNVLPVVLPEPAQSVGVYLEPRPPFRWFSDYKTHAAKAAQCDMKYLRKMGLTAISAPLTTPTESDLKQFLVDLQLYYVSGFKNAPLAYTPIKRLATSMQDQSLAIHVSRIMATLKGIGLPAPLWSIADEPSNVDQQIFGLEDLSKTLHRYSPGIKLAGHLNHEKDKDILSLFDTVLVNHGYGINRADIDHIKSVDVIPWLYNLSHPRHAAGFYLWHIGAEGYLQWHARMPTGDPFDPTDGREDDVQFLYPHAEICAKTPDLHNDLLRIVDGVTDLRWLLWLDEQSKTDETAQALLTKIQSALPDIWYDAVKINESQLSLWREEIMQLAMEQS